MVQRQVGRVTSVSVGYYGRRFADLYTTVNAAVPPSAYAPVTIANPLTGQPLTVYNQDPATRGAVRNVLTTLPELEQHYNGIEFQVNTRLTRATICRAHHRQHFGDQDTDRNNPTPHPTSGGRVASTYRSVAASSTVCRPRSDLRTFLRRPSAASGRMVHHASCRGYTGDSNFRRRRAATSFIRGRTWSIALRQDVHDRRDECEPTLDISPFNDNAAPTPPTIAVARPSSAIAWAGWSGRSMRWFEGSDPHHG